MGKHVSEDMDALRRSFGVGFRVEALDVDSKWGKGPVLRECVQVLEGDKRLMFTPARVHSTYELVPYTLEEIAEKFNTKQWWVTR